MKSHLDNPVSDLELPISETETIKLSTLKGKNIVIYFYPKDNTPGCTLETKDFRDLKEEFSQLNTLIFGVSRDSFKSHENFKSKLTINFPLVSDHNNKLCDYFSVLKDKSMFGKKYKGIERSTFLINKNGILSQEWRNVSVAGHVQEVLAKVRELA